MLFIKYIILCILAYIAFWFLGTLLIGLPGMGMALLLVHLVEKGEGALKKILLIPVVILSFLFNHTLFALAWGMIISIITYFTMVEATYPVLYFILGCIAALSIGAPSGETNVFVSVQSLFIYSFYTTGHFIDAFAQGNVVNYPHFFNVIYIISPFVVGIVILIGIIQAIASVSLLIDEGNLDKEAMMFRRNKGKTPTDYYYEEDATDY